MFSVNLDKVELEDLPRYMTILAFILSLILPGYGFLYLTRQDSVMNFESIPLILTTLFYSLPVFLCWTIEARIGYGTSQDSITLIQKASIKTLIYFYVFVILYRFNFFQIKDVYLFYGSAILFSMLDLIDSKFIFKK